MRIKLKNIIILLLLAFLFFTLNSCAVSTKWYKNAKTLDLDNNLQHLSGVYYNAPLTTNESFPGSYYPMYDLLFKHNKIYAWNEYRDNIGKIKLDVISNKKIKATYLIDDQIIKQKTITGKLKGNIFSVRRSRRFFPLLFINYYGEFKTSIFLNEENDLIIDKGRYVIVNVLLMSGGGDSSTGGRYVRVKESNEQKR